jgi:hypothetical protein
MKKVEFRGSPLYIGRQSGSTTITKRHRGGLAMRFSSMMLVCALATAAAPTAHAALANTGFEDPVLLPGEARILTPGQPVGAGWTVVGDPGTNIYVLHTTYSEPVAGMAQFNAFEGLNSIDLSGDGNKGPTAGVQQTVATTPGLEYALSFYVGRATPAGGPANVYVSPATVDVTINNGPRLSFTNSNISQSMINWAPFTLNFIAPTNSTVITFLNGTPAASNEAGLDLVDLRAVPEPSAAALVTFALVGIFCRRRTLLRAG